MTSTTVQLLNTRIPRVAIRATIPSPIDHSKKELANTYSPGLSRSSRGCIEDSRKRIGSRQLFVFYTGVYKRYSSVSLERATCSFPGIFDSRNTSFERPVIIGCDRCCTLSMKHRCFVLVRGRDNATRWEKYTRMFPVGKTARCFEYRFTI